MMAVKIFCYIWSTSCLSTPVQDKFRVVLIQMKRHVQYINNVIDVGVSACSSRFIRGDYTDMLK